MVWYCLLRSLIGISCSRIVSYFILFPRILSFSSVPMADPVALYIVYASVGLFTRKPRLARLHPYVLTRSPPQCSCGNSLGYSIRHAALHDNSRHSASMAHKRSLSCLKTSSSLTWVPTKNHWIFPLRRGQNETQQELKISGLKTPGTHFPLVQHFHFVFITKCMFTCIVGNVVAKGLLSILEKISHRWVLVIQFVGNSTNPVF